MAKLKIGINGFGRIGRNAARIILNDKNLDLVAINSRASSESHAYLLKYDSAYGTYPAEIIPQGDSLLINGHQVAVINHDSPDSIPWKNYDADIVIDSTGKFRTEETLSGHLKSGAKYVVLSSPAKDNIKTLVMGVNNNDFKKDSDFIVSNSSCTTNCLATTLKVLDDNFKVRNAFMTTTHAVTDSQNLLDNSHSKEVRLRRSSFTSIIPASTGSAKDIVKLFPQLSGKIICQAIRVPTPTVSMINLVVQTDVNADAAAVNEAYLQASKSYMKNILWVAPDELVSVDYKGSPYSSIYDAFLTSVIGGKFINLYAWYDNEWGYSTRLVDLVSYIGRKAILL